MYSLFLFLLSFPLNIFVSFLLFALFLYWHLALVLFSSLISFVLVNIIFGFLCSLGQSIVINFSWTVLILLMDICVSVCVHVCVFHHTFYCCHKSLPLNWAFAVFWSFPLFYLFYFFSFSSISPLFFIILIFKTYFFSVFILLFVFITVLSFCS